MLCTANWRRVGDDWRSAASCCSMVCNFLLHVQWFPWTLTKLSYMLWILLVECYGPDTVVQSENWSNKKYVLVVLLLLSFGFTWRQNSCFRILQKVQANPWDDCASTRVCVSGWEKEDEKIIWKSISDMVKRCEREKSGPYDKVGSRLPIKLLDILQTSIISWGFVTCHEKCN